MTTCGEAVNMGEFRNNGVMATFSFQLRTSDVLEAFNIVKSGVKKAATAGGGAASSHSRVGCGRNIDWKSMNHVQVGLLYIVMCNANV